MSSDEIRSKFLKFFENRGHKIIPSSSLVPENDPSVLFTTAGMHPLVPYLLGEKHPLGKRLAGVQKCVRTGDIDEVGDNVHLTFFEMLGNWSLGDYGKKEAISWSFEFITRELKLPIEKLAVSCFVGDEDAPRDEESAAVWLSLGIPKNRIYFLGKKDNWWGPAGKEGPCGPDTEMFYWTGKGEPESLVTGDNKSGWVEIWNNVFMQYNKTADGKFESLKQKNVDTGMGLERTVSVVNDEDIFLIDAFKPVIEKIEKLSGKRYEGENIKAMRIIADHLKASAFILGDEKGIAPSNNGQGYVLRRLIRRSIRYGKQLGIKSFTGEIVEVIIKIYKNIYPELLKNKAFIFNNLLQEEVKFEKTLEHGLKEFEKGIDPFILFTTFGFPIELTLELAKEKGKTIDLENFNKKMEEHQKLSQTSSAGMFKGGLANHNEKTIKLHTAHHLLLAGLQAVVDKNIKQRGSNITEERLRMDFLCDHKLTDEEKKGVEDWVNDKIKKGLNIVRREMSLVEAEKIGAEMEFGAKYPDIVSLYFIEDKNGNIISKEFCGGPHVSNTKELGQFKIQKEEAIAQGIRRIKAVLI